MKTIIRMIILSVVMSQVANAQIDNAEFENWSSSGLESWTTVDSGLDINKSTSVVKQGGSSAAISVNTTSQGSTDIRQSIQVSANETYDFSVWVYHTEGGVKARLYVDGFREYSNQQITNQWQQISYRYTASGDNSIEVGLRFYDSAGFDGSELVYVDDFQPALTGGSGNTEPGSCAFTSASLTLVTDKYGSETSWQLKNSSSEVLYSGQQYNSNSNYSEDFCLSDGDYSFTIEDGYGDGICCSYGNGSYTISMGNSVLGQGGDFGKAETTTFTVGSSSGGGSDNLSLYYSDAEGKSGYTLKTALNGIISNHTSRGYDSLWSFFSANELDFYFEKDNTILDIYSEQPTSQDPYMYTRSTDQCGTYRGEGDCYNREHSFPRSWFNGAKEPMNSDVHHIFATDGYVNSKRSSFPYGEVGSVSFRSSNNSLLGSGESGLGYSGTVFEPIDDFKGDLARAYFYMATRYESNIAGWSGYSSYADAVLNDSSNQVFEPWFLSMLKRWHTLDPVSQKEIDRNEAAYSYQGNRNPFIDYPGFVGLIWGQ